MIANYHTHTARCHHAQGEDIEYVQTAIHQDLKILGFSDHAPYLFDSTYYSTFRMLPEQLEEYVSSISSLKEKYKDEIEIHIGFETEYYPKHFDKLINYLACNGIEYIIMGQHFTDNEYDGCKVSTPTKDKSFLMKYCKQISDGLQTGKFTYIAHPDMIRFIGDGKTYKACMREICRTAKASNTPLELNLLGIRKKRNYPNPLFWEVAAEEDNQVILGCDAHSPDEVANSRDISAAISFLKQYNIKPIDTVTLKKLR